MELPSYSYFNENLWVKILALQLKLSLQWIRQHQPASGLWGISVGGCQYDLISGNHVNHDGCVNVLFLWSGSPRTADLQVDGKFLCMFVCGPIQRWSRTLHVDLGVTPWSTWMLNFERISASTGFGACKAMLRRSICARPRDSVSKCTPRTKLHILWYGKLLVHTFL